MQIDDRWYTRPPGVPAHDSAGGIVVRLGDAGVEVALVREGPHSAFVLPKGHVEAGERLEQAARREIAEEAGIRNLTLLAEMGVRERLDFERASWKRTHYFLFAASGAVGRLDPSPAAWFPLDALPPMFWPEQRALLEQERVRIETLLTKAAVQAQFGRQARHYARSDSHAADRDLALLVEHLEVTPRDRVLDVAGIAELLQALHQRASCFVLRGNLVHDADAPTGPNHPPHLRQRLPQAREMMRRATHRHRIEDGIGHRQ